MGTEEFEGGICLYEIQNSEKKVKLLNSVKGTYAVDLMKFNDERIAVGNKNLIRIINLKNLETIKDIEFEERESEVFPVGAGQKNPYGVVSTLSLLPGGKAFVVTCCNTRTK